MLRSDIICAGLRVGEAGNGVPLLGVHGQVRG